jgi:hypothetical protein
VQRGAARAVSFDVGEELARRCPASAFIDTYIPGHGTLAGKYLPRYIGCCGTIIVATSETWENCQEQQQQHSGSSYGRFPSGASNKLAPSIILPP